jgi:hypothetical protein
LAVVPRSAQDAGSTNSFAIAALLRAYGGKPATVVTIDSAVLAATSPGTLTPCQNLGAVLGAASLSGDVPPSLTPAAAWPDGVPPYADAGALTPVPQCPSLAAGGGVVDGADEAGGEAGVSDDGGPSEASAAPGLPPQPPHPVAP